MRTSITSISSSILVSILQKICVGGTNCLYFCPHCYEQFWSGSVLLQTVIYEENNETCCCCYNGLNEIQSRTNFSYRKLVYFTELKKPLIQYYRVVDELP